MAELRWDEFGGDSPDGPTPRYVEVAQVLEAKRAGLNRPFKLPAEIQLAEEYRVARDTLRRAMSLLEKRGSVTRRRGHGTYLHPMHITPTSAKHRAIGFIPPWWADSLHAWYTATVFDGISSFADEHHCHTNVVKVSRSNGQPEELIEKVEARRLCGLIWVHPVPEQLPLLKAVSRRIPCVVVGRDYGDENLFSVLPDYQEAAALLDAYAVRFGHKVYSVLGRNASDPYSASWIKGLGQAYAARGAPFIDSTYFVNITPFDRERMAELVLDFHLAKHPEVQLLLLTSSSYLGYMLASERFRARIADNLSLLTFDYGSQSMRTYWPGTSFTHVTCDWSRIGFKAVEVLFSILEGPEPARVHLEPVRMVEGEVVRPYVSVEKNPR